MMKTIILIATGLGLCIAINISSYAAQTIVAEKVDKTPVIDGMTTDPAWGKAKAIVTHDKIADIDVILKAVYTDKEVFFLVNFPDPNESRRHKTWVWDKAKEQYNQGPSIEDTFVFKWNMLSESVDLSVYSDEFYLADIWFWKASRTDPIGYADDKMQILSLAKTSKSKKIISKSGSTMYLKRSGDEGIAAYKTILFVDYRGDTLRQFENQIPEGSRGDIKAKGIWSNGKWTIEFSRALNTGNDDDTQFDTSKTYLFGVSRYEIAGRPIDSKLGQPLYGAGDTGELLTLQFGE